MTSPSVTLPSVLEAELPVLDSLSPEYAADPHGHNRRALERSPIASAPFYPVALSYDAVHTVLTDRRFRMPPALGLEIQGITDGPLWERASASILGIDGDDHVRLRRLVSKAFVPRAATRLRETMVEVLDRLVDAVSPAGRCDVVTDIARPYPTPVICELLGAPAEDWPLFAAWTDDIFKLLGFEVAENAEAIERAFTEFDAYVDAMVDARRERLTDDLLSDLIRAEDDGDRLTHEELRMLAGAVLSAGTDTTRNQLAAAIEVFCQHPDQWELLASRPELANDAVEEVMRHTPIVFETVRLAAEDVEVCGMRVPAGTWMGASLSAANRDPSVFSDPDTFDITKKHERPMLTFGGGVHTCLGAHLAKAELIEAFVVLSRRMPGIRLAGPVPWKPLFGVTGPATLPVEFEPGH